MDDFVLGIVVGVGFFIYYTHYESFEFLRASVGAIIYLAFFIWQMKMMPETIKYHKDNHEYGYMLVCILWSMLLIYATIFIFFIERG